MPAEGTGLPPASDWRAAGRRLQGEAVPQGPTVVSGKGPYGTGGLGRHLAEVVEALRCRDRLAGCLSAAELPGKLSGSGSTVALAKVSTWAMRLPPARSSAGRRVLLESRGFDAAAARHLPSGPEHLLAFNGAALQQIAAARRKGYRSVGLLSANSHLNNVARQHGKAWRQYPIERPWGPRLVARNLAEYEAADRVYVSSQYAWDSFVAEGFPTARLVMFPLTPHDRFQPRPAGQSPGTFNVMYVGSLSVNKGVPLLVDAVRRISHSDLRLVLVGGWSSRGMRRFIETAMEADRRISVQPGDPLPHLHEAGVYVHPSYEEGYGYAAAEALACEVPLVVSEDSAVKEHAGGSTPMTVVPTGDLSALVDAIDSAYGRAWVR
ncbi:MAG: glycosyltransferase family 4 protein [Acidimicrobiales bacterium]